MATLSLPTGVRPARVGLLFEADAPPSIERAIHLATGLWGGIYDFLIPADDVVEAVDSLPIDMLVPVHASAATQALLNQFPHLRWHSFGAGHPLVTTGIGGGREFTLVDSSLPAYQHWWDEGRHATSGRGLLPQWPATHPSAMLYSVLFGAFPRDGSDLPSQEDTFKRAFDAGVIDVATEPPTSDWIGKLTPITATALGLRRWGRFGLSDAGLVVGDPANVRHLLSFWNLRALGAQVAFCPNVGPGLWSEYHRARLDRVVVPQKHFDGERWATFWLCVDDADPVGEIEIADEILDLAPEGAKRVLATLPTRGNGILREGVRVQTESITALASLEDRFGAKYMTVSPELPFPQARRQLRLSHQQWFVCMRPYSMWDVAEGWTLKIPNLPRMNDWFSRHMTLATGDVRVQGEGFDILTESNDETISFSPVDVRSLVAEIFSRAGIETSVSTPGQIAYRILDMLGNRRQAALFRIRGVRKLLSSNEARKGVPFARAVQMVVDKDPITKTASFDSFKSYWRATPDEIVRTLLDWEALRPGLKIRCPNCALDVLIDIDALGNRVACPLCSFTFLLGPRLTGKEWVLRVSGVFEREGGPQGVIPTLLAWGELARAGTSAAMDELVLLPAHDLKAQGLSCETDFIALQVGPLDRFPSLCIGECKTGGLIEEQDLKNLAEIRRRLRASGVECHIVMAILRDAFDPQELAMLASFAEDCAISEDALDTEHQGTREASPLILMTSRDLEADPWHSKTSLAAVPHEHPRSFLELAENSRVGYLNVPLGVRYQKHPELLGGDTPSSLDGTSLPPSPST